MFLVRLETDCTQGKDFLEQVSRVSRVSQYKRVAHSAIRTIQTDVHLFPAEMFRVLHKESAITTLQFMLLERLTVAFLLLHLFQPEETLLRTARQAVERQF